MNESSESKNLKGWMKNIASRLRGSLPFISGVFASLLAFLVYNLVIVQPNQLTADDVNQTVADAMASATPEPAYSALVYQVIQPSLVVVQAETIHQSQDATPQPESDFSLGSGVVVDSFGNILTSLHVIQGASVINVTFSDGTESPAQIVTEMPELDLAVLQAVDTPLFVTPAVLGNPGAMNVGDEAFVVGNPFGLYSSMSAGVISGFDRVFRVPGTNVEIPGMIQIDAAVNPGNSGGPLLNRSGHVVGIITGIINPMDEGFFVGVGFAVPINVAMGGMGAPPY